MVSSLKKIRHIYSVVGIWFHSVTKSIYYLGEVLRGYVIDFQSIAIGSLSAVTSKLVLLIFSVKLKNAFRIFIKII